MKKSKLTAEKRVELGRKVKKLRREGKVPGNIYLLILSEEGVLGLLTVYFVVFKKLGTDTEHRIQNIVIFILFTGMWDHYWLTIQPTRMLLFLVMGLI